MAIVCRKCNYEISEQEINVHYWGAMRDFAYKILECINNFYSSYNLLSNFQKRSIKDTPEILYEKKLSAIANQQKIVCEECFQYNGWMRIANEAKD